MTIEKDDILHIICSGSLDTVQEFEYHFKDELNIFAETVSGALNWLQKKESSSSKDIRSATSACFLFNGIRNLVCSFQLLFLGYLVPSGNMMRQFMESVDAAILFSISESEFNKFQRKGADYDVGYAAKIIDKKIDDTKISPEAWRQWLEHERYYNLTSHPSAFALSEGMDFGAGHLILGSHFDPEKIEGYRKEVNIRISAAKNLDNLIAGVLL